MMPFFAFAIISMLVSIVVPTDHTNAASLGGRVTYVDGRAIVGAKISTTNVSNREVERVESDATGLYKFDGVRPGRYAVLVIAEGHCRKLVLNVRLSPNQHTLLDLILTGKTARGTGCIEVSAMPQ
jgi:hypothetical protein